jgi:hypothetical protein
MGMDEEEPLQLGCWDGKKYAIYINSYDAIHVSNWWQNKNLKNTKET